MPSSEPPLSEFAVEVRQVEHRYGDRLALAGVSFEVRPAEVFGLLGPNGGGKTTLFRLLSTSLKLQRGEISILGFPVDRQADGVRRIIGVTFQSPSLDKRLSVKENLEHQGHLYGLWGRELSQRMGQLLDQLGIADRRHDLAGKLSGGLQRRVEIAKGLLHDPKVLLLDEPSTGLDPGARHDLWRYLGLLREQGVTVLVTTHLMEEAEKCGRLGILDRGQLVALGTPEALRSSIGGDCLTLHTPNLEGLTGAIQERFRLTPKRVGDALRIEHPEGHELLRDIVAQLGEQITSCSLGKPTLEDVFIHRTGHRFWDETGEQKPKR
jgi:ABC-2 type transport system ATP-binding protein